MANTTSALFLRVTSHWIDVSLIDNGRKDPDQQWAMRGEVVGFKPIVDDHSDYNLGWHLMGLCQHVSIISKDGSKVCLD